MIYFKCVNIFIISLAIFLAVGCANMPSTNSITVSVPGYSAEVGVHKAVAKPRNVIVISMHGKEKGRYHDENVSYAYNLAKNGYTVYTPQMPWYDYSADVPTAFRFLDALVKKVATGGQKVVVAGHSQGAPYALFYSTAHNAPEQVSGVILLAPGHLVHRSFKIQENTIFSVRKARELVENGKGDERHRFSDFNAGGGKNKSKVTTTANIYRTYFDTKASLNFLEVIQQVKLPILWVDGEDDNLQHRMDYQGIYETAPDNPNNRYTTVSGGHVDMWGNSVEPSLEWLAQFN